uniref:Uncharacterized protein n=1 Tax=Elaeophora elaphi TaxID=1147741 RepID=A0A0R3RU35_9BILA
MKPSNELKKLPCDEDIFYISKPSTSSTSARNAQQKSSDVPLSINQVSNNKLIEDEAMTKIKLNSKKSMDNSTIASNNSPNGRITAKISFSNDMNQISPHDMISTHITQSVIETNLLPNLKNKFSKLQLTTNFDCYDCDKQSSCKKIAMKKYIEFDTSSFWNKNE